MSVETGCVRLREGEGRKWVRLTHYVTRVLHEDGAGLYALATAAVKAFSDDPAERFRDGRELVKALEGERGK